MLYLLNYLCPPLSVLFTRGFFSAILNCFYCLLFWLPGVRHAQWCLDQHLADKRNNSLVKAMNNPTWTKRKKTKVRHSEPQYIESEYESRHWVAPVEYNPPKSLRINSRQSLYDPRSIEEAIQNNDPTIGMNGTRFRRR